MITGFEDRGHCMVALVDAARTEAFRAAVLDAYHCATQVRPEIYQVEAVRGAEVFRGGEINK